MDGKEPVKQTLNQIPQTNSNPKRIVGLVKEGGRITGYQLSDNSIVEKQQAVNMAKPGRISGVGIAHRGDTEYLKSIPDCSNTAIKILHNLLNLSCGEMDRFPLCFSNRQVMDYQVQHFQKLIMRANQQGSLCDVLIIVPESLNP